MGNYINFIKLRWLKRIRLNLSYKLAVYILLLFIAVDDLYAQADFNLTATNGCTDFRVGMDIVNFVPDSTVWDFGDGTKAKGNSVFKNYTVAGVYTITMSAYKNGVAQVVTKNVTVHKSPTAKFTWDVSQGCSPLSVQFTDNTVLGSGPIVKRTWSFSNGVVIEGNNPNPIQTFNAAGYRDVTLIVEDQNGCKSTATHNSAVQIYEKPKVDFELNNSNSCELPVLVNFTNKSDSLNVYSFTWDFGDGKSSTSVNPSNSYVSEGNFNVTLTATDSKGCKNSITRQNLIVDENFNIAISLTDTIGCDTLRTKYDAVISSLYRNINWTFPPQFQVNTANKTIICTQEGEYTIKLEATSQFGCTISTTRKVIVSKSPIVEFTASPLNSCKLPLVVQFNNTTTGNNEYKWNFGDATVSSAVNPTKTYNREGKFDVRLNATNEYGCAGTKLATDLIIIELPKLNFDISNPEGCAPLSTTFKITSTNGYAISAISWNFGNGNTFNGINPPAQNFNTKGNYTVTAVVSFVNNCDPITLTRTIKVGDNFNINASISSNNICPSEMLTGQITAVSNATYEWKIGNDTVYNSRLLSHKFTGTGSFPVTASVTVNGCKSTKSFGNVQVKPTAANFTFSTSCKDTKVIFTNANNQGVETTWVFGSASPVVNNNRTVEYTFPRTGTFNVKMIVYNPSTGCRDEIIKQINITEATFSGFNLTPTVGCSPLTISYQAPSIPGSYFWYYKGNTIGGRNFDIVEDSLGSFDLRLIARNSSCRDTIDFKNIINVVKPEAGFKFDPIGGCSPITVTFEDTSRSTHSSLVNYKWDLGNLMTKNDLTQFTETFSLNAIIPVKLTVTDNLGCKDSIVHNLVIARPFADFSVPSSSFCTGNAFKPLNLSTGVGLQYFWDFGDGTPIQKDSAPEHYYTAEGVYDIELKIIDANNCEHVKRIPNAVTIQDIDYDFTAYPTVKHCPELLTDFTIIPQDITYKRTIWDFGNGNILDDTARTPQYLYLTAGVFDVTLTLEDYRGCKEVIKKEKLIDIGGPSGEFLVEYLNNCAPLEVKITADVKNSVANFWEFGDGNGKYDTDAQSVTLYTYEYPGIYQPSVTVDDGLGCIVTVFGPELKVSGVEADIVKNMYVVCTGENLEISDISAYQSFSPMKSRSWSFSDGYTSNDSLVIRNIVTSDSMFVYVQLNVEDSLGCKDIAYDTIRVFAKAPLEVVDNLVICKGDSIELNASRVHTYEWGQSGTLSATDISNPLAFPLQNTTYTVRGYVSPTCYTDKTVSVVVKDAFNGNVGTDTIICVGSDARLWVEHDPINSGEFKYSWQLNGVEIDTSQYTVVIPDQSSTYFVVVKNGACKDFTAPVHIDVREYPSLTVSEDQTILQGQEIRLEAISEPGVNYGWDPLPNSGCTNCPYAFVKPSTTTTYTVTVEKDGCVTTEDIVVDVTKDCDGNLIEVQNIFTPNFDGINDVFTLRNNTLLELKKMKIYSRTGELVFQSSNIYEPWDGTFNGISLNSGVYVYYIDAVCKNGEPLILKGNITLLR